jgi:hypothetical protein
MYDYTRYELQLTSGYKEKLVHLNADKTRCGQESGWVPVISGERSRPLLHLSPKLDPTVYKKFKSLSIS